MNTTGFDYLKTDHEFFFFPDTVISAEKICFIGAARDVF